MNINDRKKVEKNTKKRKVNAIFSIGIACTIISMMMIIRGIAVQPDINENKETITLLESQIQQAQEKKDEVNRLSKNTNSDEYIEKVARERLGMVKSDEIVFIDVSEKQ